MKPKFSMRIKQQRSPGSNPWTKAGHDCPSKRKAPAHVAGSWSVIDESTNLKENDSDFCEMEDESESGSNIDDDLDPIKVLIATGKSLSAPVGDESILGM